jgi:hypothetical protein
VPGVRTGGECRQREDRSLQGTSKLAQCPGSLGVSAI